jgi:hypothetical protein
LIFSARHKYRFADFVSFLSANLRHAHIDVARFGSCVVVMRLLGLLVLGTERSDWLTQSYDIFVTGAALTVL